MLSVTKIALLAAAFIGCTVAQDDGVNIIKKCDKPGLFALTFDDGPGAPTGDLLALLKKEDIKATFFSLGVQAQDTRFSHFLKQAYDEGHQIASHTHTHSSLNDMTADQIRQQMTSAETAIKGVTGVSPNYMRPPFGNCNANCQKVMEEMKYHIISWNVDSNDWQYVTTPHLHDTLVANVKAKVDIANVATDSFISLQHDIHQFSVNRTLQVIQAIRAKGFKIVTVAECLNHKYPMYKEEKDNSGPNSVSYKVDSQSKNSATQAIPALVMAGVGILASLASL
ncbi:glycoside hydrolase/deacetylase [Basidiobolus meristosporus CBS 931.73]|uniref:Glycoside hydrolase/deacetylase n=1 Tax=Basidiobolus meristosporus CBS 931.73 TaxID=1314790 RepID=A0A1Y1XVD5_9FUNG|nr:glycoside hydrolase/deacetylase [Basidiobolus meristosporus CBS 931.73]|eukprot:ORX89710.1 glycoside hydrolase/deacetylase [Basidiobolus meristosporus CBS 931.73]